jgi:hypothetical protein
VSAPTELSVVAITGVPPDLVALTPQNLAAEEIQTDEDFRFVLADPRMVVQVDKEGLLIAPSCDVPEIGVAAPPRRIVEFVRQVHAFGAGGVVQSICQVDYTGAMQSLARMVGRR